MSKKGKTLNLIEKEEKIEEKEEMQEDANSLEKAKEDIPIIEEEKLEETKIVEEPTIAEENEKIENKTAAKNHKTCFILCISLFVILLLFLLFSTTLSIIPLSS